MSKPKTLILTDLDGTLLQTGGEVRKTVIDYVKKLNERDDVIFSFSTGRSWRDSKWIYDHLGLNCLVSCCNGAHILNPTDGTDVYSFLDDHVGQPLVEHDHFFKHLKRCEILTDKGVFEIVGGVDKKQLVQKIKDAGARVFDIKNYFNLQAVDSDDVDEKLIFLKSLSPQPQVTVYPYYDDGMINIEVQSGSVNKERAMEYIRDFYQVSNRHTLTFGDQINDLSVAEGSSYFVAVKNAIPIIKKFCKRLSVGRNDDDAVIKEIDLYLKRKEEEPE